MIELIYLLLGLIIGFAVGAVIFRAQSRTKIAEEKVKQVATISPDELEKKYVPRSTYEELNNKLPQLLEAYSNRVLKSQTQELKASNRESIKPELAPLAQAVKALTERVDKEEKEKVSLRTSVAAITETNKTLSAQTHELVNALKNDSKTQGDWGELTLETILSQAGVPYETQRSFSGEETDTGQRQRPDFLIDLPDGKKIILDSKVSLTAYINYSNATDESQKSQALQNHIRSVENHITRELAEKHYENISSLQTVDFIFMFVPVERALSLVLEEKPSVVDLALKNKVVLVNSLNLVALLRTVAYLWTVDKQNKNVEEIAQIGGALYDQFASLAEDLKAIGNALDKTKESYQTAYNRLSNPNKDGSERKGTLIDSVEKLKRLGSQTKKQLDPELLEESGGNDDTD
jgi:DNA recombination protein RmuC